jgi:manganese transport protein
MGVFANASWVKTIAWIAAVLIVALNTRLVIGAVSDWMEGAGDLRIVFWLTVVPLLVGIYLLLFYITLPKSWRRRKPPMPCEFDRIEAPARRFTNIGVAIDLGSMDIHVLSYAQSLAQQNSARLVLMHIVEGVGGQLFGKDALDDEARDDLEHLEKHAEQLRGSGVEVEAVLGFGWISKEIVRISREKNIDLLIMGGHGHTGLKDLIFGTSVTKVRHSLKIPVLVVR